MKHPPDNDEIKEEFKIICSGLWLMNNNVQNVKIHQREMGPSLVISTWDGRKTSLLILLPNVAEIYGTAPLLTREYAW